MGTTENGTDCWVSSFITSDAHCAEEAYNKSIYGAVLTQCMRGMVQQCKYISMDDFQDFIPREYVLGCNVSKVLRIQHKHLTDSGKLCRQAL